MTPVKVPRLFWAKQNDMPENGNPYELRHFFGIQRS